MSSDGRSPHSSQGPPTPPTTPGELKNFRGARHSPSYMPHSTTEGPVPAAENQTNFDINDFGCSDDIIQNGALMDSSELDQYFPEQNYPHLQQWSYGLMDKLDAINVASTTTTGPADESNNNDDKKFSHSPSSLWQMDQEPEAKRKKVQELTKLTPLLPSSAPGTFSSRLFRSGLDTSLAPNPEEEIISSSFLPTYQSYAGQYLQNPYWQQPSVYNVTSYQDYWQN
ncbi:UNVERIFIED_CONTAM: hypothetical protein PYX00_008252 [Menopon gallinae]|uniref:Uncharacterized protein n=1 Tax=Menopon gallinae TaxID=328185 RepID=A0AAW2HMM2_9NEOP